MKQFAQTTDCYDRTAEQYAQAFQNELNYKPLDRLMLERFFHENQHTGTVLDVGCGVGQTTHYLYQLGIKDIIGIDLSPQMTEIAGRLNPHLKFKIGNMLKMNFLSQSIGGVLSFYSIIHLDYDEVGIAFEEIYRVLKPSGQFLCAFHIGEGKLSVTDFLDTKVELDFYFFNVDTMLAIAEKTGFKVLETLVRYPYKDKEYPSKRAYILLEK